MSRYAVAFQPSADKALRKLVVRVQRRIVAAVELLADNPRPAECVKLAGDENLWRIRVGDYRVVYEIHDKRLVILVVSIGHRRDVYRKR